MPFMFLREMVSAYHQRDPAARSKLEVLLCYPGLHAILLHRVGHGFWTRRFLPARPHGVAFRPVPHRDRNPSLAPNSAAAW